jgi:predicted polyphosphate/ATP-dependent NAD kinase
MGDHLARLSAEDLSPRFLIGSAMTSKRVGLIINPVAGLGGRVGLKGSDGQYIQQKALELGAVPAAGLRCKEALETLIRINPDIEFVTYPGEMGADCLLELGVIPKKIGLINAGHTTNQDTHKAAKALFSESVDLILFAGGDGTARDIYLAIGSEYPVLGIPAGVKIHSGVFGTSPMRTGELASLALEAKTGFRQAEVLDIDEDSYRQGILAVKLCGYLKVPYQRSLIQSVKASSSREGYTALAGLAAELIDRMDGDHLYILGPGTTTQAIARGLGLEKTLLGVDIIKDGKIIRYDVNEKILLDLLRQQSGKIIVTPIGGQGIILGRGNQQLSPQVIHMVGTQNLIIVSTRDKINALLGRPLLVDTGYEDLDRELCGYTRVITGYREEIIYRVKN